MDNLVGVIGILDPTSPTAKRALLLFDRIITRTTMSTLEQISGDGDWQQELQDYGDTLQRLAIDPVVSVGLQTKNRDSVAATWWPLVSRQALTPDQQLLMDVDTLALCEQFSAKSGTSTVPLLFASTSIRGEAARRQEVLGVALKNLPLPNLSTPWSAVLDWRLDGEARTKYRRFRTWLNRMSREGLSPDDINDELATLIDDYEQYMAAHHAAIGRGRIEVLVVAAAQVIESLVTFRPSTAVEKLYGVFRAEASARAAGLVAPGREVAYIVETRRLFSAKESSKRGLTVAFQDVVPIQATDGWIIAQ